MCAQLYVHVPARAVSNVRRCKVTRQVRISLKFDVVVFRRTKVLLISVGVFLASQQTKTSAWQRFCRASHVTHCDDVMKCKCKAKSCKQRLYKFCSFGFFGVFDCPSGLFDKTSILGHATNSSVTYAIWKLCPDCVLILRCTISFFFC